jgi:hypothetical protein
MKPALQPYQQEILGDFANNSVFDLDSLKELYNSLKRKCSICELPFLDSEIFEINNEYNCINCWEQLNEMSPQKSPRPKTISELRFENDVRYEKSNSDIFYDYSHYKNKSVIHTDYIHYWTKK